MALPTVAIVAPDSDVQSVAQEVRAVTMALPSSPLVGTVTVLDVMHLLTSGQEWDILWFAAHGTADGVQVSDGLVPTATLITLVRNCNVRLVVLNTCESEQVAMYLHVQTGVSVVCTIAPVGDRTALITGTLLAQNLADGLGVRAAFERSRPGDVGLSQRYRLFAGDQEAGVSESTLETRLSLMERDIKYIREAMTAVQHDMRRTPPAMYALWGLTLLNTVMWMVLMLQIGGQ